MSFGTSPGNVAVHHGSCTAKVIEKRVKIAELVLRVLIFGLYVLAASLIGFDSEVKVIFSITKKTKFIDMKDSTLEKSKQKAKFSSKTEGLEKP